MLLIAEVKPALPVADARVSFSVPDVTFWAEVLLATALSPAKTPAPVIARPTTAVPTPSSSGTARRRRRSSVWVSSDVTAYLLGQVETPSGDRRVLRVVMRAPAPVTRR